MASSFGGPASDAVAASALATATAPVSTPSSEQTTSKAPPSASPPSVHNNYHAHRQNNSPSKLPAYRFVDLKKESLSLPTLLHQNPAAGIPPSPVSPDPDHPQLTAHRPEQLHNQNKALNQDSVSPEQSPPATSALSSPVRSRASTFQIASTSTPATPSAKQKRTQSLDSPTAADKVKKASTSSTAQPYLTDLKSPTDSTETIVASRSQQRRAPASFSSNGIETASGPPPALITQGLQPANPIQSATPVDDATKEWAQGQRELLLPKTIRTTSSDDKRGSVIRRPPVSYKPPPAASIAGGTTSIPPIRSFRSSGSRKSLVLDMNLRPVRAFDAGDDSSDSNHRDQTLRALEGRHDDDALQLTPPDSAIDRPEADDSGDVFLKIAREEPRRVADENGGYGETQSAVSRVVRSTHRRPLSAAVPSYQPTSPPQITRRLSDQQETSRARTFGDDQSAERMARTLNYRGMARDKPADDPKFRGNVTPLRASQGTSRTLGTQDTASETGSAYSRRRQSITDSRMSSLKQSAMPSYRQNYSYNSSPLVPKSMDTQRNDQQQGDHHGRDGTESSASTAAPSTVWDELDDMKSRLHRLELTGKLPPTSGAAMSRASEERPPTANTNATTMSSSPKRGGSGGVQQAELASTTSSQREGHPLLQSALQKSRPFLTSDVYSALETATSDALALAAIIGPAGQPGPISSGASTIGGGGPSVTDRQLRRKADSICRSLTELCLALSEATAQIKQQQISTPVADKEAVTSPTTTKFSAAMTQRRPSVAVAERSSAAMANSPRAMSRLEEKRSSMMFSALPSPSTRYTANTPTFPTEGAGRKTSLLIARTRRAGTEEPEEQNGRRSSLLRTRRAGTEEPEEATGRRSSLLRTRRADNEDEEPRFRAPSRAITEVAGFKSTGAREFNSQVPVQSIEQGSLAYSALPRRRLASSTVNTRLVQPAATSGLTTRRYFDRSTPDRETMSAVDNPSEERSSRSFSLLGRAGSLGKRTNRESMMTNTSTTAQAGGYR